MAEVRVFNVRVRARAGHGGRVVSEASHEAAAIAFVEDWAADAADQVAVVVRDEETGTERCSRIDLGAADVEPC
jgi:hypothetical protein